MGGGGWEEQSREAVPGSGLSILFSVSIGALAIALALDTKRFRGPRGSSVNVIAQGTWGQPPRAERKRVLIPDCESV